MPIEVTEAAPVAPGAGPAVGGQVRVAVAGSMAGKVAEAVTLALLATVVPRALGPDAYGRFSVPLTIVTLGSLAMSLGGPTLMARYVPTAPEPDRVALARALGGRLARGRALQLAALVPVAGVAVAVDPDAFPPATTALVLVALAASVAAGLALQVPLGLGRTVPWALRYPLQNAVLVAAVLVLHPLAGDTGAVVAILVSALAALAFAAVVAGPVLAARVDPVPIPAGAVRFGRLQAGGAALVQAAHRGGVVAVAVLGGSAAETGYAALAIGIALGATYAVLQAFTVALPHLSDAGRAGAAGDPEAVLGRLADVLLLALVPGSLVAALLLDTAVPAVFGDDFRAATAAFGPALALVVLAPLSSLLVQVAALRFRPGVALANGVAAAATFLVVAALAVPRWEAAGATAAGAAATAAGALVSLRLLPGAARPRTIAASLAGAALVMAVAGVAG
ncbi:MAG TPA: hypothetical protein VIL36_07000 [Acidimicrobiales bacterium]